MAPWWDEVSASVEANLNLVNVSLAYSYYFVQYDGDLMNELIKNELDSAAPMESGWRFEFTQSYRRLAESVVKEAQLISWKKEVLTQVLKS